MKKAPFLILTISLIVLFSLISLSGQGNVYASVERDPVKDPLLSDVFVGIGQGIPPLAVFDRERREEAEAERLEKERYEAELMAREEEDQIASPTPVPTPAPTHLPSATPAPTQTPTPTPGFPEGRLEPLRESTYEEYKSHISADIYGDLGVQRAASYEFCEVPIEYFDDALFIGDSRTVGLGKYTDLSEHAEFYCATSLTVKKVFTSTYKGKGSLEKRLSEKQFGKIYVMVGINELGLGTTEYFMEDYTAMIDHLRELQPDALIFIQAIMNVDKEKNDSDRIFNNTNILGRNHAIATLADNKTIFYIDVNEAVCDEEGNLNAELTFDHLHLKGSAAEFWKEFLMQHGVVKEGEE